MTPTDTHARTRTPLNDTEIQVTAPRLQLRQTYFLRLWFRKPPSPQLTKLTDVTETSTVRLSESDPLLVFQIQAIFYRRCSKDLCLTLSSSPSDSIETVQSKSKLHSDLQNV